MGHAERAGRNPALPRKSWRNGIFVGAGALAFAILAALQDDAYLYVPSGLWLIFALYSAVRHHRRAQGSNDGGTQTAMRIPRSESLRITGAAG